MNVRATAKFVGTSTRKVGLVAALIRGRKAGEASAILMRECKRATDPVGKVLKSAVANAENNYNLHERNLIVESVFVGPGPTLKRIRPRAKGSASSIRKRSSHITVVLRDDAAATRPVKKPVVAVEKAEVKATEPKPVKAKKEAK